MKSNPGKILLLGATGRTGKEVLFQALDREYHISALVRDKNKIEIKSPNLFDLEGDTRNPKDLRQAMQGCEAVISCLNISRKSEFPWSPLRTPPDFLSLTMKNLLAVCNDQGVKRLIFTSAWGVGDSRPYLPAWFSWFIDNSNLSRAYLEHERQEVMVRNSGLDWTIVRPVVLNNSKKSKPIKVILNNQKKPSLNISRKDTAKFILDSLQEKKFIQHLPVISY